MSTPSSGPLKFSDLATEFSIDTTQSLRLSQFYRGGIYIKNNKAVERSPLSVVPVRGNSINLGKLKGVYKHYAYTFTFNNNNVGTITYQSKGIGSTIVSGDANFSNSPDPPGQFLTDRPVYAEVTIPANINLIGGFVSSQQGSNDLGRENNPALRSFVNAGNVDVNTISYIINYGNIYGTGGAGNTGGGGDGVSKEGLPGYDGGHAIVYGRTTYLENYGKVYGGGGGGGGGGFVFGAGSTNDGQGGGGGGGGQGWNNSSAGAAGPKAGWGGNWYGGADGSNGSISFPGNGGGGGRGFHQGGNGGSGGSWGQNGSRGRYGYLITDGSGVDNYCNSWNFDDGPSCGVVADAGRRLYQGGEKGFAGYAVKHQSIVGTFQFVNVPNPGTYAGQIDFD
jgi:hypothetical protein